MKKCFKCNIEKDTSEYYKHPKMADGLLGKCKQCTRQDTAANLAERSKDPDWLAMERARHRVKSAKARESGMASPCKNETKEKWANNNPHKVSAQKLLQTAIKAGKIQRMPCEVCGHPSTQGHHHDYTKPLDVWWLCAKHHGEAHHKDNPLILGR